MHPTISYKNNQRQSGFTFAEMIITVAILGILASVALPRFTELTFESKLRSSEAKIINIQLAFMTHYYNSSFEGQGEFPPSPNDSLMTLEWSRLPILYNGFSPSSLFSTGKIPMNPDGNPYIYHKLPANPSLGISPGFKLRDPDYELQDTYRL